MKDLNGKVAVVTGGGSGIGRAVSLALAHAGAGVAVCDLNADTAKQTAALIAAGGASATAHQVDVSAEDQMRALVDDVLGAHRVVDIVVNNAGISTVPVPTVDTPLEVFHRVIDINMWGMIHGSVLFLPHLLVRPTASLVNVASLAAVMACTQMSPYNTSKFGVRGFTEALQMEFAGSPLKITLVCPGGVKTSIMTNSPVIDPSKKDAMQRNLTNSSSSKTPEFVADTIVKGIRTGKPRILIGSDTKAVDKIVRLLPGRYPGLMRRTTEKMFEKALG